MATNRSLETRVEKLERAAGIGEDYPPVMFVNFVRPGADQGVVVGVWVGIRSERELIARPEGETEEEFIARMEAEHRRPGPNGVVLIVERRWADDPT